MGSAAPALDPDPQRKIATQVLELARTLAVELRPELADDLRVTLRSELDRDLGLDSLGRAELLARADEAFEVSLPTQLLRTVATPGDLVVAVVAASAAGVGREAGARVELGELAMGPPARLPEDARTLPEALAWHVAHHPARTHLVISDGEVDQTTVSYMELDHAARRVAGGLRERGIEAGERVAIMLPTGRDFFESFFGVLYAGAVPVPIYPPTRLRLLEDHMRRQAGILNDCRAAALITFPEARAVAHMIGTRVRSLRVMHTSEAIASGELPPLPLKPSDIALLQYTSGSTGDPKGVVLTHANLLANVRGMVSALEVDSKDVIVSWLPLYHDMGLIGTWMGSLYSAAPLVVMSPLDFLVRPDRWLRTITRHRGTLSAAPNFAYELCVRKIDDDTLAGLDLSTWRWALNGAEPVSAGTLRRFAERFSGCGFRAEALTPCYGLAETSVGLTFPPPGRGPRVERIDRQLLTGEGRAMVAPRREAGSDADVVEAVACGRPLPGHEIRVVDPQGGELPDRFEGRIEFRGPSATSGYYENPAKTAELVHGDWRDTGDLGYVAGGDLFVTGRIKDMLIRAGRNLYPHELEDLVGDVDGIRKGCVAVFGSPDPKSGTERLVVVAETREDDDEVRAKLRARVDEVTTGLLDAPAEVVVLAPPHAVLKTSSGKIRRAATRQRFEAGEIDAPAGPAWRIGVRLAFAGAWAGLRARWRRLGQLAYAGWWWLAGALLALLGWPFLLLLPTARARWGAARWIVRLFFFVTGMRLRVHGNPRPPGSGAILISNHASYLDGAIVAATVKGPLTFLVKRELANNLVTRSILGRLGSIFVERYDPSRATEGAHQAADAAREGACLVFFPEGTTTRRPGLASFHLGAFIVAAQAQVPVLPLAIRGSRSILRSDVWFPRPGVIDVDVGELLEPDGEDIQAARRLRERGRAFILEHSGDPDLAGEENPLVTRLHRQREALEAR